jgi:hypothetical protein
MVDTSCEEIDDIKEPAAVEDDRTGIAAERQSVDVCGDNSTIGLNGAMHAQGTSTVHRRCNCRPLGCRVCGVWHRLKRGGVLQTRRLCGCRNEDSRDGRNYHRNAADGGGEEGVLLPRETSAEPGDELTA